MTRPVRAAAAPLVEPTPTAAPVRQAKPAPAPFPRVYYRDEVAAAWAKRAADRDRSLLVRWAARLTGRPAG